MRTEEGHPIQNKKKNKRRECLPTPVLPGEFHGQRSLVGCSPWGHKESDTSEQLTHTHTHTHTHKNYLVNGLRKEREKGKTAGGNGGRCERAQNIHGARSPHRSAICIQIYVKKIVSLSNGVWKYTAVIKTKSQEMLAGNVVGVNSVCSSC